MKVLHSERLCFNIALNARADKVQVLLKNPSSCEMAGVKSLIAGMGHAVTGMRGPVCGSRHAAEVKLRAMPSNGLRLEVPQRAFV